CLKKAAGGIVNVVLPRAEEAHMSPASHRRSGSVAGLQNQELQAALKQVCRCRKTDRTRADHHNRLNIYNIVHVVMTHWLLPYHAYSQQLILLYTVFVVINNYTVSSRCKHRSGA